MIRFTNTRRIRTTVLLLVIGAAPIACGQSRPAEDASQRQPGSSEGAASDDSSPAKGDAETEPSKSGAEQGAARDESEKESSSGGGGKVAGGPRDPEEIPVAVSPKGLLKPGAEEKVRERLGVKSGGSLREPLKKFQQSHDLPATGILDHRTAEELGLDPDETFESAGAE